MVADETLKVIHLDAAGGVLAVAAYGGAASHVDVPVRAIIADALRLDAAALILSHDHPSGDPRPSAADRALTTRLARLAKLLGFRLHDHLIHAGDRCTSLRALGLL